MSADIAQDAWVLREVFGYPAFRGPQADIVAMWAPEATRWC